jgi:hypothetical protein
MKKVAIITAMIVLISSSIAMAQDFCKADFDYDGDCDAADVGTFLQDFGRSPFYNPCPSDGPAPVPRTGWTTCYDLYGNPRDCEGTGEDGEYQMGIPFPNPRFIDNGDGTVSDKLTGLMWEQKVDENNNIRDKDFMYNWEVAIAYCEDLILNNDGEWTSGVPNTSGVKYDDFRLPNMHELLSIVDYSKVSPCIDTTYFPNVVIADYWTSNTIPSAPHNAWVLGFGGGHNMSVTKLNNRHFRAVRGGRSGSTTTTTIPGRFTDNEDGTITDNDTGFMWTQDADLANGVKTWQEAVDYIAGMNTFTIFGYTDWRLPELKELHSLIDFGEFDPALTSGHPFLNIYSDSYWWSNTIPAGAPSYAWQVYLHSGNVANNLKADFSYYVWPVRGGTPISPPSLTNNGDGTVTDSSTGLMWTQDADLPNGTKTWQEALDYISGMNSGIYTNFGYNDWRLPEVKELHSLIDYGQVGPALPSGHPFLNIHPFFWSNTTAAESSDYAWHVYVNSGNVANADKTINNNYYVWPVRGGH